MKAISSEVYINIASSVVGYRLARRAGGFTLSSLFDNGEAGTAWGNLPYYSDTAGTEEATWGDPVGLIQDASGNGADFTQATVTARPVLRESDGIASLEFDGTDDLVSAALPAITDGTLVIAGTNGIWIDDDYNFDGGTFSIGPTSYTNGPDGILPVIGDLIVGGTFVIDRQLTAEERDKVILKLKAMGAPGVFGLGPELVVNGDFSDGLNGWTFIGTGNPDDCQVIDNQLVVIGPTSSSFNLVNDTDNAPPGQYIIAGERIASEYNGSARIRPTTGAVSLSLSLNTQGAFLSRVVDIENSASLIFQVTNTGNAGGTFDNFSMRKLELVP